MWNRFKTFDPWLYVVPLVLLSISIAVVYALTITTIGPSMYLRQGLYGAVGIVLMILATFVDYRSLKAWSTWIYGGGIILLLAVRVFGHADFGAKRWIDIGFFQFQPGELEKLILIIVLAAVLSRGGSAITHRWFAISLLLILIPFMLIMLQPDLGTALVVLCVGIGMLLHAHISRLHKSLIVGGIGLGVLVFTLSFRGIPPFTHVLQDYQKARLENFIHPAQDTSDSGYHVAQSVIAVGSGGLVGKTLQASSQSQLNFLPVAYADFIFAVIAEAWGLVGSFGVIGLFVVLILRVLQAARIAKDEFGMLICVGVIVKILFEVLVNIGMNIGIMPVTGIPLPFLSYGGTTLLTNMLAIGLVQSIVIRYKRLTF